MKILTPLEKDFYGGPINYPRFWATLTLLEQQPMHPLQKYNRFQMIRMRYWQSGEIAYTHQAIADLFGSRPEYIRSLIIQGLRIMRHPRYKLIEWL